MNNLIKKVALVLCTLVLCTTVIFTVFGSFTGNKPKQDAEVAMNEDKTSLVEENKKKDDLIMDLLELKYEKPNESVVKNETIDSKTGKITVPFDEAYPEIFESGKVQYSDETLMIKFNHLFDGVLNDELKNANVAKLEKLFDLDSSSWYVAYIDKNADIHGTMEFVRQMDSVLVAEYNFKYETEEVQADDIDGALNGNNEYKNQWYTNSYGIKDAWKYMDKEMGNAGGSKSVVVAVIDTGIDYNHRDLASNIWKNSKEVPDNGKDDDGNGYIDDYYGVDITSKAGSGMDDHGHGTHVAGIIGAVNNKEGVVGLAYNTKIMPVKAADASGYFLQSNIAEAILYAYDHGASVINMSFGGTTNSIAVQDALAIAYSRCVLVASAGNSGEPNEGSFAQINYPAAYKTVLGVMSVDGNNVESSFTNWDVNPYNEVEYDVYAPGENILSTIPNNKYAYMSGTSMAAPVVAAQAALLRSVYDNQNMYPNKFIYAQIIGTSVPVVKCIGGHDIHNIPGLVNYYQSMTSLPEPELVISDTTIFDTKGFKQDKYGKNNGDGTIDAGETIALGFTLKNRWGMSEDTIVSIDAISSSGVANPYVTIINNNINYGSIGTYSEGDSGKIMEDGMWKGWENPFYIQISKDCPNNSTITINATLTYKNGLNDKDNKEYVSNQTLEFVVRRGTVLPKVIAEDTTLTKDDYYIISNTTTVNEGVTLRIEEGTKVQFWSDDPNDAYAETAVVFLQVNGSLIVEGTENEPVELFPSDLKSNYAVRINGNSNSYIYFNHAEITNPELYVNTLENCVFKVNHAGVPYYFNSFENGRLQLYPTAGSIYADLIYGSVFYKVASYNYEGMELYVDKIEKCLFLDSFIEFNSQHQNIIFLNNVFYGNNNFKESETEGTQATSSITVDGQKSEIVVDQIFEIDDNVYFTLYTHKFYEPGTHEYALIDQEILERFLPYLEADWISIDSKEEYNEVVNRLNDGNYRTMLAKDESGYLQNHDGSMAVGVSADASIRDFWIKKENGEHTFADKPALLLGANELFSRTLIYRDLLESKYSHVKRIELSDYLIHLSEKDEYQINARLRPDYLDYSKLRFESENPEVAIVDENGVITAVAEGTARIVVSSADYAVSTHMTVNVEECIELESLAADEMILMVERSRQHLDVDFAPLNTTQRALEYISADENVATVDHLGKVTAVHPGVTTIRITGANECFTEVEVHVFPSDLKMEYSEDVLVVDLSSQPETALMPSFNVESDLLKTKIQWTSSNTDVIDVDSSGLPVIHQTGTVTLRAEIKELNLCDDVAVNVIEASSQIHVKQLFISPYLGNTMFAVLENGEVWYWGDNDPIPQKYPLEGIEHLAYDPNYYFIYCLFDDGTLVKYNQSDFVSSPNTYEHFMSDVRYISESYMYSSAFFAVQNDGSIWAWGRNGAGQFGFSSSETYFNQPQILDLDFEVKQIVTTSNYAYILTEDTCLYTAGYLIDGRGFTLIDANVESITPTEYIQINKQDELYLLDDSRTSLKQKFDVRDRTSEYEYIKVNYPGTHFYIEDGFVYVDVSYGNDYGNLGVGDVTDNGNLQYMYMPMVGIENAEKLFVYDYMTFINTIDGKFYATGDGRYLLGNGSLDTEYIPVRIVFGTNAEENPTLEMQGVNVEVNYHEKVLLDKESISVNYNDKIAEFLRFDAIQLETTHPFNEYTPISTTDDLMNLSLDLNGKYYLTNDIVFDASDFEEGGRYDNNGQGWIPVGNSDFPFTGIFDGNGYSIKGLVVNSKGDGGLFGTNKGLIRNLSLEEGTISGNLYTGGVAAVNEGLITNCYNANAVNGVHFAGGIVGYGNAENCTNAGDITVTSHGASVNSTAAGGIAGSGGAKECLNIGVVTSDFVAGGIAGVARNDISDCVNEGNVILNPKEVSADKQYHPSAGGIAGYIEVDSFGMRNCHNKGTVTSTGTDEFVSVGGLAGTLSTSIQNCSSTGSVVTNGGTAGGITGMIPALSFDGREMATVQIVDCLNSTDILVNENAECIVGGFVGENEVLLLLRDSVQLKSYDIHQAGWLVGKNNSSSQFYNCYGVQSELAVVAENKEGIENIVSECVLLESLNNKEDFTSLDFKKAWKMTEEHPVLKVTVEDAGAHKVESVDPGAFVSSVVSADVEIKLNSIVITPVSGFKIDTYYRLKVPTAAVSNSADYYNNQFEQVFVYRVEDEEAYQYEQKNDLVINEEIMNNRESLTEYKILTTWEEFEKKGLNSRFYSNVILNRLNNDDVESWLRVYAGYERGYYGIGLGENYWGTTNEELINKQIIDYDDYSQLGDINIGEYLTEAPEDTYPFVVDAYLEVGGEQVDTVANELVTFVVNFNRDMDTSIDLDVRFGSEYPYADYVVEGSYATARQWRGEMQLTTIIENGYQYWSVSNGKAAGTTYKLYTDWGRFPFRIDTSSAQALLMQAEVTAEGIHLTWSQDDFVTLAGYNVYRSDREDGLYTRINRTVIPAETKEWFDDTVEPGKVYYYNFTVVQSDMEESEPSGKIKVASFDTMAPNIYHSPVYHTFTGSNLIINATVTDNIGITRAVVYYRVKGTDEYESIEMNNNNDRYSALIPSSAITLEGLEYYIEATDGDMYTYKGSAAKPYSVTVQDPVPEASKGDVNGDGLITLQDAMLLLYAINDKYNMTEEEFARADINGNMELEAKEALIIIRYVNGTITSIPAK